MQKLSKENVSFFARFSHPKAWVSAVIALAVLCGYAFFLIDLNIETKDRQAQKVVCGNGTCETGETKNNCSDDCRNSDLTASKAQTPVLSNELRPNIFNLKYSSIDSDAVKLDLYFPNKTCVGKLPLVINIHGGAFKTGDKGVARNKFLTENCYAFTSINYRLSGEAVFPAGVQDVKSAVRWLRANADKYNLDSTKFGVIGGSAGGYFASFLGTTGDIKDFDIGDNLEYSSAVQAVVDEFGPVDMSSLFQDRIDVGLPQDSAESAFIGCNINSKTCTNSAKASPIKYVSKEDPSFLILHGAKDRTIPIKQSQDFYNKLQDNGVPVTFTTLPNAGHGGPEFNNYEKQILEFFDKYLKM